MTSSRVLCFNVLQMMFLLALSSVLWAGDELMEQQSGKGGHRMIMDDTGMVMNYNSDVLPEDCESISRDYEFTIMAGTKYATPFPDTVFGFNDHEWRVEPCSRITIIFKNEDEIRHQWMVHRLPKYLYDQGMFHMEASGGQTQTGVFIVPSDDRTYLAHCDIAQHMEKGMKAQLIVGKGSGDLWSIPGVTANFERAPLIFSRWQVTILTLLVIFAVGCFLIIRRFVK
jgi:hypothetical protein